MKLVQDQKLEQRVHSEERIEGVRAKFHIYMRSKAGRVSFVPSWFDSIEGTVKEYRKLYPKTTEFLQYIVCDQSIKL